MIRHLAAFLWFAVAAAGQSPETRVGQWTRFEAVFQAAADYPDPLGGVTLNVAFRSPSGQTHIVVAFWDGGRFWRARFAPDEIGSWSYRTGAEPQDFGLHNKSGTFQCVAGTSHLELFRRGAIRVSKNRHHFEHADGTPFFWLGDTVWNGALLSDARDWNVFLEDRAAKGFTVIQFVTTQWSAAYADATGRVAYRVRKQGGREELAVDPTFFQRLDDRVSAINTKGMLAAPVLLWAHPSQPELNPGVRLSEAQMIQLGRYLVARYGAHQVVWMLNGDGDYSGENAPKWKRVGRAVFANPHPGRLATMHPGRLKWTFDEHAAEPWYSFTGYQSGHRDDEAHLKWLVTEGPPSKAWRAENHLPVVNLEPNYEDHRSRSPGATHVFTGAEIRRAAYWSLLVGPPAGVTYGAHGIWSWETRKAEPLNHTGTGPAAPWTQAMALPGSTQMSHLAALMRSVEWWKLRPAPQLLAHQPGNRDVAKWVAAAAPEDGRWALVYVPAGSSVLLRPEVAKKLGKGRWFNPRTGLWRDATNLEPPDASDWVLHLRP